VKRKKRRQARVRNQDKCNHKMRIKIFSQVRNKLKELKLSRINQKVKIKTKQKRRPLKVQSKPMLKARKAKTKVKQIVDLQFCFHKRSMYLMRLKRESLT
jgi:hypothetical protein